MLLQQVAVVSLCVFVLSHSTFAVVNNAKAVASPEASSSSSNTNAASSTIPDSAAASSEQESNRREIPAAGLSDSYGLPLPGNSYGVPFDTYGPPVPSNPGLPVPVYGVPDGPTKNVVYPAPPPDLPPPLPSLPNIHIGPTYGPPKPVYGPPAKLHPPTHHKSHFHKPSFHQSFGNGFSQGFGGHSFGGQLFGGQSFGHSSFKIPKPSYGPPPPSFIHKPQISKPIYGPPKLSKPFFGHPLKVNFGPPKPIFNSPKPAHGPIKITNSFGSSLATYGPPHTTSLLPTYGPPPNVPLFNPPKAIYGPPKDVLHSHPPPPIHPAPVYGPPEPVPHGPPHPGAPAPPTPPDIKYDGWQPILGLVSHPPSGIYGAPQHGGHGGHGGHGDLGLTPPNDLAFTYASSFAHGTGGAVSQISHSVQPSDSYGAPLNTVTGSGGVVSSSGNDHVSLGQGSGNVFGGQDSSLSVIKSIGYEIFPSGNGNSIGKPIDSYGAPPPDSFSPNGPYAAAFTQGKDSFKSFGSTGFGLNPPSGLYGVPPGSQYGTPLLSPPKNFGPPSDFYGPPQQLNALDINPPKSPVVFREPVPPGLIQSIGESVVQKDAHGIEHSHSNFQGQSYIPPPVPDITKQKDGGSVNPPTNLYSLPNTGSSTSFQSVVHGATSSGFGGDFGSTSFNFGGDHGSGAALTSYTAPLNVVDSSYGLPLQPQALTAGFDQSFDFGKQTFGGSFASSYAVPQISLQSTLPLPTHDCSQKSQQFTSYGVPSDSASSYSASISSLNTNIGNQQNYQIPSFNFVNNDLQGVHSLPGPISIQSDEQLNTGNIQGKSLGQQYLGKDAEFQQSQELHIPSGVQNIPIQGNLGSYTLQIQSADGLQGHGQGQPAENVPHEQVLSEGLLQSILSAIEQPDQQHQLQQQQQQQLQQHQIQQQQFQQHQIQQQQQQQQHQEQQQSFQGYGDLQHGSSSPAVSYQQQQTGQSVSDGEAQHSVTRQVVITPPAPQQENSTPEPTSTTTASSIQGAEQPVPVIDNNEIALYFNSPSENKDIQQQITSQGDESDEVRNGQQYGSFVSFKTPHSSYVYGELKSSNGTAEKTQ